MDFGLVSNALLEHNLMNFLVCSFVANALLEHHLVNSLVCSFVANALLEHNLVNSLVCSFVANAFFMFTDSKYLKILKQTSLKLGSSWPIRVKPKT